MIKLSTAALFLFILLCLTVSASAAIFVVNTAGDTNDLSPGDGVCSDGSSCSLRAAITEANALAGSDIITLGAVVYSQTLTPSEENQNAGGDWDIRSDITINGAGEAATFLQAIGCLGGNRDRVLDVSSGVTLTLNSLTVRSGCLSGVAPPPGGGILSSGSLILNNVTVRDNEVQNFDGGASGGGIYNLGGSLTLNNSTVTNNKATSTLFVPASGGGIHSQSLSPVAITGSSITGNTANGFNQTGFGGGMYVANVGTLTIANSHFDNNTVQGSGNNNAGGGLYILSNASSFPQVNITGSTFNDNTGTGANASGVGFYLMVNLHESQINVRMDQITISGNSGNGAGAGMQVFAPLGRVFLEVKNTTISNNIAGATGGGVDLTNIGGSGGRDVSAFFTNTTISGNSGTEGGGVAVRHQSGAVTATFDYCTLTNNTASVRGGGLSVIEVAGGSASFKRTVIAQNTAPAGPDIFTNLGNTVSSQDYNHIGTTFGYTMNGGTAHNTFGGAMLGALANNGGPTLTHMPNAASPVVDAIPFGEGGCGTSVSDVIGDQRGLGRTVGTGCDKGSVERDATLPAGPWDLSGTIRTAGGLPVRNVLVRVTGGALPPDGRLVYTGQLGTYVFLDLPGGTYMVTVKSRRFTITGNSQTVPLGSDNFNVNFTADPDPATIVKEYEVSTGNAVTGSERSEKYTGIMTRPWIK